MDLLQKLAGFWLDGSERWRNQWSVSKLLEQKVPIIYDPSISICLLILTCNHWGRQRSTSEWRHQVQRSIFKTFSYFHIISCKWFAFRKYKNIQSHFCSFSLILKVDSKLPWQQENLSNILMNVFLYVWWKSN